MEVKGTRIIIIIIRRRRNYFSCSCRFVLTQHNVSGKKPPGFNKLDNAYNSTGDLIKVDSNRHKKEVIRPDLEIVE